MKNFYLYAIIIIFTSGCNKVNETKILSSYLDSFGVNLKNYKVISFVPADGCSSCILPTLDYSKKANGSFLMVLSSISEKSNNYIIQLNKIEESKIIKDSHNLAAEMGFVPIIAPRYYFIRKGHIVKSIDLSVIADKTIVLKEVDKYLTK